MRPYPHILLTLFLSLPLVLPANVVLTVCVDTHDHDHHAAERHVHDHVCDSGANPVKADCPSDPECDSHQDVALKGSESQRSNPTQDVDLAAPLAGWLPAATVAPRFLDSERVRNALPRILSSTSPPVLSCFLL